VPQLELTRQEFHPTETFGRLVIPAVSVSLWTVELPVIDGLPGSAIPIGTYPIVLAPSPKFLALGAHDPFWAKYGKLIPHLYQIENRTNIEIHTANTVKDVIGCIGVGLEHPSADFIGSSRNAFEILIGALLGAKDWSIKISGEPAI
jgi:hypothetical protein